jgi:hypothetical protein
MHSDNGVAQRRHKPKAHSVAEVQSILGLDSHHAITRIDFIETFVAGKLDARIPFLSFPFFSGMMPVQTRTCISRGCDHTYLLCTSDHDGSTPQVDGFPLIKEALPDVIDHAEAASMPAPVVASRAPPMERAADWRLYEGDDLGGRCRIRVYFSTTTSSMKIRSNVRPPPLSPPSQARSATLLCRVVLPVHCPP